MRAIVTDERRCDGPKAARPEGVALKSPVAASQRLSGQPSPAFALLLPTELFRAITVDQPNVIRL